MTATEQEYAAAHAELELDEAMEREAEERHPVIVRPLDSEEEL